MSRNKQFHQKRKDPKEHQFDSKQDRRRGHKFKYNCKVKNAQKKFKVSQAQLSKQQ